MTSPLRRLTGPETEAATSQIRALMRDLGFACTITGGPGGINRTILTVRLGALNDVPGEDGDATAGMAEQMAALEASVAEAKAARNN